MILEGCEDCVVWIVIVAAADGSIDDVYVSVETVCNLCTHRRVRTALHRL